MAFHVDDFKLADDDAVQLLRRSFLGLGPANCEVYSRHLAAVVKARVWPIGY